MKDPRDVIFEPVVSEKTYDLIERSNTYTFLVDRSRTRRRSATPLRRSSRWTSSGSTP